MMFVGDGIGELGSAVAATGVGVAAGIGPWSEQAAKTMRIGTSAQIGSLVIRVLSPSHQESELDYKAAMKVTDDLAVVRDWASIAADAVERCFR